MGKEFGFLLLYYFLALADPSLLVLGFVAGLLSQRWWHAVLGGIAVGSALFLYYGDRFAPRLTIDAVYVLAGISLSLLVFGAKRAFLARD